MQGVLAIRRSQTLRDNPASSAASTVFTTFSREILGPAAAVPPVLLADLVILGRGGLTVAEAAELLFASGQTRPRS